ncbi:aminotransferase class I/II-fold pyridoxal phosphate-dependent enzyme [Niveispirillum fermenti]|uniref:aminotransferase class I/II-fold pyridoxal phosphate-dependent enzyme n=1 Tax=Niveispirillum fermenti TaxID=1233113 RepID=UPI003A851347
MLDAALPAIQAPCRNDRLADLCEYPFPRLHALLAGVRPLSNVEPTILTIGEPQNEPPSLLTRTLAAAAPAAWAKYPPTAGTPGFRTAVAGWLARRFDLPPGFIDADRMILPVCGTREALYQLAQLVVPAHKAGGRPVVLIPNPFYAVYQGAAVMAGAEPVLLDGTPQTGFLPDLDSVPPDVWARTALFYLCTPANPQGAVASLDYLKRALLLARRHGFTLAVDECYGELWHDAPPAGGMDAALALGGEQPLSNLLVFHSLSKRSSAAGLRSGFMAGDPGLIAAFTRLRAYSLAGMPLPVLDAAAALWADDAHVAVNRDLYRANVDAAEAVLDGRLGYYRPDAGFFLWLDVGDVCGTGEEAACRLWREGAIRVLPGAYLTQPHADGYNPGDRYIRVALVHDTQDVARSIERLARILS